MYHNDMKHDANVIDKFYKKGLSKKRIVFQLVRDTSGRFQILREGFILVFFSEERQALIGFESLKGVKKVS